LLAFKKGCGKIRKIRAECDHLKNKYYIEHSNIIKKQLRCNNYLKDYYINEYSILNQQYQGKISELASLITSQKITTSKTCCAAKKIRNYQG